MRNGSTLLAILGLLGMLWPANAQEPQAPSDTSAGLPLGIGQVNEGKFSEALITLDAAIQRLAPEAPTRAHDLSRAHLYKGIAYVGLAQEDAAKASFREALSYEPALRLRRGEFSDRTIRIFEAARTGKTKSVLERPNTTPKKAGIGAGVILGIVGGVALVAGGAAVVASGGGTEQTPPPPTPLVLNISLLGSVPPPGSTIRVAADGTLPLQLSLQVGTPTTLSRLVVSLVANQARCWEVDAPVNIPAGQTSTLTASGFRRTGASSQDCLGTSQITRVLISPDPQAPAQTTSVTVSYTVIN